MPATKQRSRHQHTTKAGRMAGHIVESAKQEGRYKGREKEVAWATVHKEMPKREAHRSRNSKKRRR
jgi:hypothetical protein